MVKQSSKLGVVSSKRKTKPTVKSRSKGNKANPTCQLCGKVGHYSSTCPALASKLFNAVKKTAGTAAIRKFLENNVSVRVQGLEKKPLRTKERVANAPKLWRGSMPRRLLVRKVRAKVQRKENTLKKTKLENPRQ